VVVSVLVGPGADVAGAIGIALLPAAIAVAVLRHGLWDVDLVIRRSLVYGLLTAIVVALYVATVGLLGGVLGRTVGAPLVATGIIAVAVQPLRERLQRGVNQLLYGDREDPYTALTRLSRQLDATVDRGVLLDGVAGAVVRALRLRGAAIDVDGAPVATVGELGTVPVGIPLTVRGEEVGILRVAPREDEELTAADRRLLQDLARHVAAVVRAERLQAEVEASRARLVTAREEERRRIRRDLHDELGPTLAAIGLQVERANLEVASDPATASRRLDEATAQVRETVRSVRALVEGLRPAALDELGLAGAVRELLRGLDVGAVEVTLTTDDDLGGLPAAVDVAAYRIVGEAVTNVLRHASATRCDVTLHRDGDRVVVIVEDDGQGLGGTAAGVGRHSMTERATELGGRCEIVARRGGGTRVTAVLPAVAP
jgi:signal transduction histidine kinase